MRVVAVILLLAACHGQETDIVDWVKLMNQTTMGGPINDKGLLPCNDECLCEHPIRPQMPYPKVVSLNELIIGFGKVTETMYCDVATQLQMKMEGSDSWVTMYNGPRKEVLIQKVPIDIQVSFRIRERNCMGVSPFSEELIIRTPDDKTRPSGPTADTKDGHSICMKWMGHGETPVSLEVRSVPIDDATYSPSWATVYNGISTEACAENLTSATYYQFRIKVHDPELDEPISDSTLVKTDVEVPLAPSKPYATETHETELVVQWSRPVSKVNNSPVQLYVVEAAQYVEATGDSQGNGDMYSHLTFYRVSQVEKMQVKITGLKPGKAYAIRVSAVNAVGESPKSPVFVTTTKAAAPSKVDHLEFTAATSTSIRVDWAPADPAGSPILDYEVEMSRGGAKQDFFLVYKGVKNHTKAEGLDSQVFYGFRIRAHNAAGYGEWSGQYNLRTPQTGEVASEEDLAAASKPMVEAAAVANQALLQVKKSKTAANIDLRRDAILSSQIHLQLTKSLAPQPTAIDPKGELDALDRSSVSENDPKKESESVHVEPPSADGACDLREGCLQKDALLDVVPPCPGGCYVHQGHGFCLPSGNCHCAFGWKGDDCNTALCPDLGGENCGGHGKCTAPNVCTCQPGYNSPNCRKYFAPRFTPTGTNTSSNTTAPLKYSANFNYPTPNGGVFNVTTPATLPDSHTAAHPRLRPGARRSVQEKKIIGTYLAIPASPSFDFQRTDSFTISLWFRATEQNAIRGAKLLTHGPHKHGPGYGLGIMQGGKLYCGVGSNAEPFRHENVAFAVTQDNYADNAFHHVACRYNGQRQLINLLVDGNEVALSQPFPFTGGKVTYYGELDFSELPPPTPSAREYPLVIGASWDFEAEHFDGEINDVRIWRNARQYDEIRAGMWYPMTVAGPNLAIYLPLSDCRNKMLTSLRWEDGKQQIIRYPNPFKECEMVPHPLVSPVAETGSE